MVLSELGSKISQAIQSLGRKHVVEDSDVEECIKEVCAALLKSDVNIKVVSSLRARVKAAVALQLGGAYVNKQRIVQRAVVESLVEMLAGTTKPFRPVKGGTGQVVMFVGLQGAGKTTTCTKYALYHQRKGFKVALVCADTYRAGAFDQLRQNAMRARIPFYGAADESDAVAISKAGVDVFKKDKYDLIIVDTSGRHKQDESLIVEMKEIAAAVKPEHVIYVMDSHIGQACADQVGAFHKAVPLSSVILTKLDGAAKGGGALSAVASTGAPIAFTANGEGFEALEPFEAKSYVSRILGMGDVAGFMDKVSEAISEEKQAELMNRMKSGRFSLRDFYEQLESITKMGPLGQLMGMVPGFSQMMGSMPGLPPGMSMGDQMDKVGTARMKSFLVVMDSLTAAELDSEKTNFEPSRITRVARGAGVSPQFVVALLEQHKQFHKMMQKLCKTGLMGAGGELSNMKRNPGQVMRKLQQAMDPAMVHQMGGMENLFNMIKSVEEADASGELPSGFGARSKPKGRPGRGI